MGNEMTVVGEHRTGNQQPRRSALANSRRSAHRRRLRRQASPKLSLAGLTKLEDAMAYRTPDAMVEETTRATAVTQGAEDTVEA